MGHLAGLFFSALVTTVIMLFVYMYDLLYKRAMYKGQWEHFMNNDGLALVIGISVVIFIAVVVALFYLTEQVVEIFGRTL